MASVASLTDNFNAGINGAVWETSESDNPAEVTALSGGVKLAHTAASEYQSFRSVDTALNLVGSSGYVQVTDYGNQALTSHECYFQLMGNFFTDGVMFAASQGQLGAYKKISGTQSQVGASIALDVTAHRWLRLRESGGTTFWDTAPDGVTWTNRWSIANPITLTDLQMAISCGAWQTEASGSQMKIDNVNTLGVAISGNYQFFAMARRF
jgi:hypothetical protein